MGRSRYGPLSNQRCNLVSPLAAEWRTVRGWHRRPQIGQKTAPRRAWRDRRWGAPSDRLRAQGRMSPREDSPCHKSVAGLERFVTEAGSPCSISSAAAIARFSQRSSIRARYCRNITSAVSSPLENSCAQF